MSSRSILWEIEGYEPVCLFARGGMAQVFLARTVARPTRLVAIKTLRISYIDDPESVAMFADEMRIAHLLRHPNIVELVEAGVIKGEPFLVLEFIDGPGIRDLAEEHRERGEPIDIRLTLSLLEGACQGLAYAHELVDEWGTPLELVHRDVCPQNLMVNRRGVVKVLDFGVAKAVGQSHQTIGQAVKGKMAYSAPEYIRGCAPDQRADVFALGAVAWELLCNQRLFFRATAVGTMQAVVYDDPKTPSELRAGITKALDELVLDALEKDPEDRIPRVHELIERLAEVAEDYGGLMGEEEIARSLAAGYPDLMDDWPELRPEMTDAELKRGAERASATGHNGDLLAWRSVEIDLSDLDDE